MRITFINKLVRIIKNRSVNIRQLSNAVVEFNYEEAKQPNTNEKIPHTPVMLKEVLSFLNPKNDQVLIDMTFGSGQHTEAILKSNSSVRVYGLDRDPVAFEFGQNLSKNYPGRFFPLLGRFSELNHLLKEKKVSSVDGILFDLGCSSMQFDNADRGFALSQNGPLDMRMDGDRFPDMPTCADIIEHLDENDLARIIRTYGEEKHAKRIASEIMRARYCLQSIKTTGELVSIIHGALGNKNRYDKLSRPSNVATKTFQALRIFVNNELNELNRGLEIASEILKPNGILVTISFHSLEDRIIKRHLSGSDIKDELRRSTINQKYKDSTNVFTMEEIESTVENKYWTPVNKHVIVPSKEEVNENPRSRSSKLRCALRNSYASLSLEK